MIITEITTPIERFEQKLGTIPDCLEGIWPDGALTCVEHPYPDLDGYAFTGCPLGCEGAVNEARQALVWLGQWDDALTELYEETDHDDNDQQFAFQSELYRADAYRRAVVTAIVKHLVGDPDETTYFLQLADIVCRSAEARSNGWLHDSSWAAGHASALSDQRLAARTAEL